jgi:DNA primase
LTTTDPPRSVDVFRSAVCADAGTDTTPETAVTTAAIHTRERRIFIGISPFPMTT